MVRNKIRKEFPASVRDWKFPLKSSSHNHTISHSHALIFSHSTALIKTLHPETLLPKFLITMIAHAIAVV